MVVWFDSVAIAEYTSADCPAQSPLIPEVEMEAHDEALIKTLAPDNDELREAYEEHSRLDSLVGRLTSKAVLSAEEELEKKTLQKRKLIEKDKIMRILAEHRRHEGDAPTA